ncbi:MAG: transcription-repair coupling factor [Planctomycetes bacterium]|nr:transcription-repair coupling factor [Planctomycetota bacterium]
MSAERAFGWLAETRAALARHPYVLAARDRLEDAAPSGSLRVGGLHGASQALVLAALAPLERPLLVVAPTDDLREELLEALSLLAPELRVLSFPGREGRGARASSERDARAVRERLATAGRLRSGELGGGWVLSSVQALLEPLPSARSAREDRLRLAVGERLDERALFARLAELEYERVPQVASAGEFARRGDVIDLFPHGAVEPVRIEVFDDEIEALRAFDASSQRSHTDLPRLELFLGASADEEEPSFLVDELPPELAVVETDAERGEEIRSGLRLDQKESERALRWEAQRERRARVELAELPDPQLSFSVGSVHGAQGEYGLARLKRMLATEEQRIVFLAPTAAEVHRVESELGAERADGRLAKTIGFLGRGFRWSELGLTVIHHHELSGRREARRAPRAKPRAGGTPVKSFLELTEGDHVVHAVHGVARFVRVETLEQQGGREEYLALLFADEALLYVPLSRIDLVQRYVGSSAAAPKLDKLGGKTFRAKKLRALEAVRDLAADLLRVQALRAGAPGYAYPPEGELEREFVESFPFDETPDQTTAWAAVREDMEAPRPMDRLICGDVGYGKTEIAMRAAFKAAAAGRQCAVLVPTTILAQQHLESFRERFADFPVEIDMISRFRSPKEQKEILERASAGAIDVLIGTHRLVSKDVKLPRLGLLVIDEEQRFGVEHKERLKNLRAQVDVLTLTATPIPRTLHMALVGARDISALTTAPRGRQEIDTSLGYREDDTLIQEALRRELHRGGQAFFLHNRVQSIREMEKRIRRLVPEVRLLVGHGQMPEDELEEVMARFGAGDADVLLATTIIESGLDIPRANTILIDRADTFGLAELHQLRGRVGRWKHKAWCKLLIPANQPLTAEARARLKAIEELHELGAGFKIAMRDLEIRGAGNLLGAEQSGHIHAIGYELYCRLVQRAVDELRRRGAEARGEVEREQEERAAEEAAAQRAAVLGEAAKTRARREERRLQREFEEATQDFDAYLELGIEAHLPAEFVGDRKLRLQIYRELDEIREADGRARAAEALRDRFGRLPDAVERLLDLFLLKRKLGELGLRRVRWSETHFAVEFRDARKLETRLPRYFPDVRVVSEGRALLMLPPPRTDALTAFDRLKRLALDEPPPAADAARRARVPGEPRRAPRSYDSTLVEPQPTRPRRDPRRP